MKRYIAPALVLAIAALPAFADQAADRKAITNMFAAYDKAIGRKDAASIRKMMAPNATVKGPDGKTYPLKDQLAGMEAQLKMAKSINSSSKISKIDFKGNNAIVTYTNNLRMVMANPQTKKDSTIVVASNNRSTLVRSKGGWLMQQMETLKADISVDGKKMNMPGAANTRSTTR